MPRWGYVMRRVRSRVIRLCKSTAGVVMVLSALVIGTPQPVAATGTLGEDHRGTNSTYSMVADTNSCDQIRQVSAGTSPWDYSSTDVLRIATGTVKAGGVGVRNAVVFSFAFGPGPQILKMSCAITNENGEFTIDVLKNVAGTAITVAPPHISEFGTQLGSRSILVPATSTDTYAIGDITLTAANNAMTFYSQEQSDFVTGPTNVACISFDPDNDQSTANGSVAGCTLARGRTLPTQDVVALKTASVRYDGQDYPVVRFYLDDTPTLIPSSFHISGLSGDYAQFNGRWATGTFEYQEEEVLGVTRKYLEAFVGESAPTVAPVLVTAKVDATVWTAWSTIPTATLGPSPLTLNGDSSYNASIAIFSRNDGPEVAARALYWSQTDICRANNTPVDAPTCTPYKSLTTPFVPATQDNAGSPWSNAVNWYYTTTPNFSGGGCGSPGSGNYQGLIVDQANAPYTGCGFVDAAPFSTSAYGPNNPGWQQSLNPPSSSVDASGRFGFTLAAGIYKLTFRPEQSTTIPDTSLVVRVSVSGGVTSVERCVSFSLDRDEVLTDTTRCTSGWVSLSAVSGNYPFQVLPANFYGQVLLPSGSPVANDERVYVDLEKLINARSNYYFGGDGSGTQSGAVGKFLLRIADGSYQLRAEAPEGASYPPVRMYIKVSSSGSVIERCTSFDDRTGVLSSCTPLSGTWESPAALQFRAADFTGRVSGSGNFWVEVQKKNPSRCADCYDYLNNMGTSANNSGTFSLTFDEAGEYKLVLNPPQGDSSGATRTEVLVAVAISGETKTLTVSQAGGTVSAVNDVYPLTFASANFVVQVQRPDETAVSGSWVSVQQLEAQGTWANFNRWIDSSRTGADGRALLNMSTAGYFKLVADNTTSEPYPELATYIKVVRSGGNSTFYSCGSFQSALNTDRNADGNVNIDDALVCDDTPLVVTSGSPLIMRFVGAEFQGRIVGSTFSWVEIQRLNTAQCENCFEWVGGAQTNSSGVFGINFADSGTYRLTLNPPWNDTSGATRTDVTVVVTGASGSRSFTVTKGGSPVTPTAGVYEFTLNSANLRGVVKAGPSAEPYPNISFERWNADTQQYEGSSTWANGNAQGQFSASLADGTWKVTARPGFQSEGTATPSVAYVTIAAGVVSAAGVATTRQCADGTVASPCTVLTFASERYEFVLGSPNFAGFVTRTSSAARGTDGAPTSTSDAVSFSWIEVQAWNQFEQQYRWSPEIGGVNTSSTGRFATNLPAGNSSTNPDSRYQIIVNARPQDASAGYSRGVFRVKVVGGAVRCESTYAFCEANASPTSSDRFDLHLSSANLTGTVTAGGSNVVGGQIRAERWNGQWFEWVNLWAQTGGTGGFAMNLDTAGVYKVTAEAPFWNNTYAGFAAATKFVKVVDGSLCEVDDENDASCNGPSSTPLSLAMPLAGANVRGTVSAGGQFVRNSWVNVLRYNSVLGWWEWVSGAPVNGSGQFSLSLAPTQDGDTSVSGTQQRFRLEVMPPWGNSSLTRKEVQLWVGAVGQESGVNYYVECSTATFAGCPASPKSGNRLPTADVLAVTLTSGNLTGKVTTDGTVGMSDAWINVERWSTPTWARSPMWQWVDINANTNQSGNYNLNLEGLGDGYYRVTANPGWNNPTNLTRTSVVLKQAGAILCTVDDAADASCNDIAANPFTRNIQLTGANLVGTLRDGGSAVGFSWVSLMREQNGPAGAGDTRTNTWYEWLGGANTNATGGFGLRIDSPGRYQLEVNPPFNSPLSRFSVFLYAVTTSDIRICASRTESNTACAARTPAWTSGYVISFPTANVTIRVCDKDDSGTTCMGVQNAWVNVFSGNEWVGGANTNSSGLARFSLPNGSEYRFEANPNWTSPDGVRVETASTIKVVAGALDLTSVEVSGPVIAKSTGQIDLRLGSPNVNASVYYQDGGTRKVMPWSYVAVRDSLGNWLPGAPVDGSGNYRLSLANGSYTLTAFANPGVADRAPASISVTVTDGLATCTGGVAIGDPPVGTCSIDFDQVAPNVTFTMSNMGTYTRALYVYQGSTLVTSIAKAPVSGFVAVRLALADGTYTLRLQSLNTVTTDGTTSIVDFSDGNACQTFELVVSGSAVSDQPALNAWASGFVGNDATTGLECAVPAP